METFVWDPRFETGIASVDRQHHRLVDLVNRMNDTLNDGSASEESIGAVFGELADYAQYHFADEERLMAEAGVDQQHAGQHQQQHQQFTLQLTSMWNGRTEIENLAEELYRFLTSWLTSHILGTDQAMALQIALIHQGVAADEAYRRALQGANSSAIVLETLQKSMGRTHAQAIKLPVKQKIRLALLYVVLMLIPPLVGGIFFITQVPQIERTTYANLQAIAQLKADQIKNWLAERRGDAAILQSSRGLASDIDQLAQGKVNTAMIEAIRTRLRPFQQVYAYHDIIVQDRHGAVLMALEPIKGNKAQPDLLARAFSTGQVQQSTIFRDQAGDIHIDWLVPIITSGTQSPIAVVTLRAKPNTFLYPLIQTWPGTSPSAETLLVERKGAAILYLNELRHRHNTALNIKLPADDLTLPAAIAVRANHPGTAVGRDYRGVEVLAAYRPVVGTGWHIVAKVDRDEVLAPLWNTLQWILLITIIAVAGIMLEIGLLWRAQQRAQQLVLQAQQNDADLLVLENKARRLSLLRTTMAGFWLTDEEGRLQETNARYCKMSGYSAEELLSMRISDLEAAETPDQTAAHLKKIMAEGDGHFESRHRRKDGSIYEVEISAQYLPAEGGSFVVFIQDITERKRGEELIRVSEEQFRTMFNEAPLGIALIDSLTGHIHQVNPVFAKIAGRTLEQMANLDWMSITHPDDIQADLDNMALLNAGKIPGFKMEKRYLHLDGTAVWINMTIAPLKVEDKVHPRHLCMIEDISARKAAEAELTRHRDHLEEEVLTRTAELAAARDAAEAANRAKSVFLTNMSHELRTPLNGVMGLTDLILRRATDPQQIDWLNKSQTSARHLLNILNDILNLSRIEAGQLTLQEQDFSLAQTINDILKMQDATAKAKGLSLSCEIDAKLPAQLSGDALHLKQILLNYLGNAIKFTERGQISVRAHALEQDRHSVLLKIEVTDTGIGISPEQISRLFQPFIQADDALTRSYGGSGLGLVISKRIALLMGGDAGVESTPGVGSTFWATVRLKKQPAKAAAVKTQQPIVSGEAEALIRANYSGHLILVVDDEPINLEVAQLNLEAAGLAVDTAKDGAEAVAFAKKTPYAAIFMDMQMPKLNGLNATRQIRQLPGYRDIPIIAMTASAYVEDKALCIDAGMNDFLAKPFSPDMLFTILLRALSQRDD